MDMDIKAVRMHLCRMVAIYTSFAYTMSDVLCECYVWNWMDFYVFLFGCYPVLLSLTWCAGNSISFWICTSYGSYCVVLYACDDENDDHDGDDDEDDEAKRRKKTDWEATAKHQTLATVIANIRRINISNIHQSALKLVLSLSCSLSVLYPLPPCGFAYKPESGACM